MKKTIFLVALFVATAFASQAQVRISFGIILGTRQPNPNELALMRREEAANPTVATAMHNIENAIAALNAAPDNFGGQKAHALADLHQAWVSLRRSLYYRIYVEGRY